MMEMNPFEENTTAVAQVTMDGVNRESGEESVCPRIVLIDKDGVGYQAVSMGIYSAIKKLMTIKGNPATWKKPVKLKVTQVTKGDRKLLTLNMVK